VAIQTFFELDVLIPERMSEKVEANTVCSSLEKPLKVSAFEACSRSWEMGM